MKCAAFIVSFIFIGCSITFAQTYQVDQKKLDALKKQAEAMKGMNRKTIASNPDSALAAIRQMLKSTDSIKNRITHDALKTVPMGAQAERYLNATTKIDTSYTIVQFQGSVDQTAREYKRHVAANCFAQSAPMIQHGSSFSVTLMSNPQLDKQAAAVKDNRVINHTVKYVIQRGKFEGHSSLTSTEHVMESLEGYPNPVNINTTINTEPNAKSRQFIFSFDTLTNIGQVSYLEVLQGHINVDFGPRAGTTESEMTTAIAAITDPNKYDFGALSKDKASVELDKLTDGQLLNTEAKGDGDAKPVLVVEKMSYGFKLTCHAVITKGGETTTTNITAYIGRTISEYEAIIKPVEEGKFKYEKWIPKGPKIDGSDDSKGDDSLQFYVVVRDKKDPSKLYSGDFKVEWRLNDVTKYPGFCNNYPAYTENPDVNPDLKFDPLLKNDDNYDPANTDDAIATTKDTKGKYAFVHVISMDYAAWGRLKATITLDDGSLPLVAHPYYSNGLGYITIPYDVDENRLADAWEKSYGLMNSGHPLTWDEDDKPDQQKDNGDGLTLFEEYRGFAVHKPSETAPDKQDVHERTNPTVKDAFVFDRDQLFQDYYEKDNPSNLNWHYVAPNKKQFINRDPDIKDPLHRVINFNKVGQYFYAHQFCIALYKEGNVSYDPDAVGITWSRREFDLTGLAIYINVNQQLSGQLTEDQKEFADNALKAKLAEERDKINKQYEGSGDSPLKTFIKCSVYPIVMQEKYLKKKYKDHYAAIMRALMKSTVIHEVGHNLGIVHHQGPKNPLDKPGETQALYGNADGVLDCAMRYSNPAEGTDITYLTTVCSRYCRKKDPAVAWTYTYDVNFFGNRVDKNPEGVPYAPNKIIAGTKPSDNCYGQITLKGKPDK